MSKKNKVPTSVKLSDKAKELLVKLAEKDDRSQSYIIENLILAEAERLGITVD